MWILLVNTEKYACSIMRFNVLGGNGFINQDTKSTKVNGDHGKTGLSALPVIVNQNLIHQALEVL